jgi:hypothetical protein
LKQLKETPYSQEEADAAAGLGTYKPPQAVTVPNVAVGVDIAAEQAAAGKGDVAMAPIDAEQDVEAAT